MQHVRNVVLSSYLPVEMVFPAEEGNSQGPQGPFPPTGDLGVSGLLSFLSHARRHCLTQGNARARGSFPVPRVSSERVSVLSAGRTLVTLPCHPAEQSPEGLTFHTLGSGSVTPCAKCGLGRTRTAKHKVEMPSHSKGRKQDRACGAGRAEPRSQGGTEEPTASDGGMVPHLWKGLTPQSRPHPALPAQPGPSKLSVSSVARAAVSAGETRTRSLPGLRHAPAAPRSPSAAGGSCWPSPRDRNGAGSKTSLVHAQNQLPRTTSGRFPSWLMSAADGQSFY